MLIAGPRPSQRPSRASWQFTNFAHFLSRFGPCPRPFPRPCANEIAGTAKTSASANNNPRGAVCLFIFITSKAWMASRFDSIWVGLSGRCATWQQFACRQRAYRYEVKTRVSEDTIS